MATATCAACPWSLQVPFAAALVGSSLPDALRFGSLAATLRLRRLRPFCALTAMFLLNVNRCGSRPGVPGTRGGRRAGAGRSARPPSPPRPGDAGRGREAAAGRKPPDREHPGAGAEQRRPLRPEAAEQLLAFTRLRAGGPLLLGFGIHFLDLDTKTQNMTFFPPQRNRR